MSGPHLVSSPEYEGPERRQRIVIDKCADHKEHRRVLANHDKEIDGLWSALEQRRESASKAHGELYEEIKGVERAKVPNKLFYLFISVYSILFIVGIVSVYKGMNQNALTFQGGISEVKVMQAEMKSELKSAITSAETKIAGMKDDMRDLKRDLNRRTRGENTP